MIDTVSAIHTIMHDPITRAQQKPSCPCRRLQGRGLSSGSLQGCCQRTSRRLSDIIDVSRETPPVTTKPKRYDLTNIFVRMKVLGIKQQPYFRGHSVRAFRGSVGARSDGHHGLSLLLLLLLSLSLLLLLSYLLLLSSLSLLLLLSLSDSERTRRPISSPQSRHFSTLSGERGAASSLSLYI